MVALSLSKGFRGLPSRATILQPEVNMGKSLNILRSPPVEEDDDFDRFSLPPPPPPLCVLCRSKEIIAGFSMW